MIDGRRAEAKLMNAVRSDLTRHLGGAPSVPQRILIDRCAALTLRLHLMDRAAGQDGAMSEKNAREYLCWNNALTRLLRTLGLQAAPAARPSLREYLDAKARPPA